MGLVTETCEVGEHADLPSKVPPRTTRQNFWTSVAWACNTWVRHHAPAKGINCLESSFADKALRVLMDTKFTMS